MVQAQTDRGSITGVVTDPANAAVGTLPSPPTTSPPESSFVPAPLTPGPFNIFNRTVTPNPTGTNAKLTTLVNPVTGAITQGFAASIRTGRRWVRRAPDNSSRA